jgi:hypothetical protein
MMTEGSTTAAAAAAGPIRRSNATAVLSLSENAERVDMVHPFLE